jgi:hypothetical protein
MISVTVYSDISSSSMHMYIWNAATCISGMQQHVYLECSNMIYMYKLKRKR